MSTSPEQVPQPSAWGPWRKVRGITPGWAGACLLAWGCAVLVAAVTVPLKYPYEAAGTVVDSAAVMGLLGFVAVVGLSLREGPRHLVRGAALRLWPSRLALAASCTALVGAASWGLAILAGQTCRASMTFELGRRYVNRYLPRPIGRARLRR